MVATNRHWDLTTRVPWPRPGWLSCPICYADKPVLRKWAFHTRSGAPTIAGRCDVHFKCRQCAAGWWHGVALDDATFNRRPRPANLTGALYRAFGGGYEPDIFAGIRSRGTR